MGKIKVRVVLDTNIIISAILFGGKPARVLQMILDREVKGVTSPILMAELQDVLIKTFKYEPSAAEKIGKKLSQRLKLVRPENLINVVRDKDDNRVLEAAVTGICDFIVTGDKDLLGIKSYKRIKIVTASQFLVISGVGE